jgi:hypothetical protein
VKEQYPLSESLTGDSDWEERCNGKKSQINLSPFRVGVKQFDFTMHLSPHKKGPPVKLGHARHDYREKSP